MNIELTKGESSLIINCIEFSRRNIGAFMEDYDYSRKLLMTSFDIPPPLPGFDIDYFNKCMLMTVGKICDANLHKNWGFERPKITTTNNINDTKP